MKKITIHRAWATMVELMAALGILSLGITALLQTLWWGIRYANDTENNIKAINIAREWIEAVINIRDTNWLRFSSDRTNCWIVKDYQTTCIGNGAPPAITTGPYTIISANGAWYLSWVISGIDPLTSWPAYKSQFQIGIDSNGFYTQTGITNISCDSARTKNCVTNFTREVYISTNPGIIAIKSVARWYQERPRSVTIETTLTNWKSRF